MRGVRGAVVVLGVLLLFGGSAQAGGRTAIASCGGQGQCGELAQLGYGSAEVPRVIRSVLSPCASVLNGVGAGGVSICRQLGGPASGIEIARVETDDLAVSTAAWQDQTDPHADQRTGVYVSDLDDSGPGDRSVEVASGCQWETGTCLDP